LASAALTRSSLVGFRKSLEYRLRRRNLDVVDDQFAFVGDRFPLVRQRLKVEGNRFTRSRERLCLCISPA